MKAKRCRHTKPRRLHNMGHDNAATEIQWCTTCGAYRHRRSPFRWDAVSSCVKRKSAEDWSQWTYPTRPYWKEQVVRGE